MKHKFYHHCDTVFGKQKSLQIMYLHEKLKKFPKTKQTKIFWKRNLYQAWPNSNIPVTKREEQHS